MATINEQSARSLAANKGRYEDDRPAYAVFKYYNHHFDKDCFAVAYSRNEFLNYATQLQVLEILWSEEEIRLV